MYLFKIVRILLSILGLAFVLGSGWYILSSAIWDQRAYVLGTYQDDETFIV